MKQNDATTETVNIVPENSQDKSKSTKNINEIDIELQDSNVQSIKNSNIEDEN